MRGTWCFASAFVLTSTAASTTMRPLANLLPTAFQHGRRLVTPPTSTRRFTTKTTMTLGSATQISRKMFEALNTQGNRELQSSLMYGGFGLWFQHNELKGSQAWCQQHADIERDHAYKLFNLLVDRDIVDTAEQVDQGAEVDDAPFSWEPKAHIALEVAGRYDPEFSDPIQLWRTALEHERTQAQHFLSLVRQAREEGDFITEQFLMADFIPRQMQEETAVTEILSNAKLVTKKGPELYFQLDKVMPSKPH